MKAATIAGAAIWLGVSLRLWLLARSVSASPRARRGRAGREGGLARRGAAFWLGGLAMLTVGAAAMGLVFCLPLWQRGLMTGAGSIAFVSPLSLPALLLPGFLTGLAAFCLLSLRLAPEAPFDDPEEDRRLAWLAFIFWLFSGLGIVLGFDDYIEVRAEGVAVNPFLGLVETLHPWEEIARAKFYPGEYVWYHQYSPPEPEMSPKFDLETRKGEVIGLWNHPIWPSPRPYELRSVAQKLGALGIPMEVEAPGGLSGREAGSFYEAAALLGGKDR